MSDQFNDNDIKSELAPMNVDNPMEDSGDVAPITVDLPDGEGASYLDSFNIDMGTPGETGDVPHYIINLNMYNPDGFVESGDTDLEGMASLPVSGQQPSTSTHRPTAYPSIDLDDRFPPTSSRPGNEIPQPFLRPMFRTRGRGRGRHHAIPLDDVMERKIRTFEGRDCIQHLDQLQRLFPRFKRAHINRIFTRNMLNYDRTFHQLNEENDRELAKCANVRLLQSTKRSETKRETKPSTKPDFVGLNPQSFMYLGVPLGRCPPHVSNTLYRRVIVNPDGSVEAAEEHEKRYLYMNGINPNNKDEPVSKPRTPTYPVSRSLVGQHPYFSQPNFTTQEPPMPPIQPEPTENDIPAPHPTGNKFFRSNREVGTDDAKRDYVTRELRNTASKTVRRTSNAKQEVVAKREDGDAVKYMASVGVVSKPARKRNSKRKSRDPAELEPAEVNETVETTVSAEDASPDDDLNLSSEDRVSVLRFFNDALPEELSLMPGCSRKTAEVLVSLRPFTNMSHLLARLSQTRYLSPNLIDACKEILQMRSTVIRLLQRCERLTERVNLHAGSLLENSVTLSEPTEENVGNPQEDASMTDDYINESTTGSSSQLLKQQPAILNPLLELKPYQLVGLNWFRLLHREQLNGILADEMGLGKTIQAIAFLASLWESGDRGPHLIICPSSTQDNWQNELANWCPHLKVLVYQGSVDQRRSIRMKIYDESQPEFNVLLTSYAVGTGSMEDRALMKRVNFHYGIFDEAHMLKNMTTQRYKYLANFRVQRRLLLTGTPLQNNLLELVSLLSFVMPDMFSRTTDLLKRMFQIYSKPVSTDDSNGIDGQSSVRETRSLFELERLEQAKNLLQPFCLRRLKSQVLDQLPPKTSEVIRVQMTTSQSNQYWALVGRLRELAKLAKSDNNRPMDVSVKTEAPNCEPVSKKHCTDSDLTVSSFNGVSDSDAAPTNELSRSSSSPSNMVMQLRKAANHELLLSRIMYSDDTLRDIAHTLHLDTSHSNSDPELIYQDLLYMNDHQVHKLCQFYEILSSYTLPIESIISGSGKIVWLKENIPRLIAEGHRILIFSQFIIVLDIVEEFLQSCDRRYVRLDGSTPVNERQQLVDRFNSSSIELFLLSTRAGGLGINLTGADTVIIHDIDFNPYNDRQAEDRVHRLGQSRPVHIMRLVSEGSVEEGILRIATEKLELEQNVTIVVDDAVEMDANSLADTTTDSVELNDEDPPLKVLGPINQRVESPVKEAVQIDIKRNRPDERELWPLLADALQITQ